MNIPLIVLAGLRWWKISLKKTHRKRGAIETTIEFALYFCFTVTFFSWVWSSTQKVLKKKIDGRNPKQPPGMYKTLLDNGINYQPQLVSRFLPLAAAWVTPGRRPISQPPQLVSRISSINSIATLFMESFWKAFLIHLAEIAKSRLWCREQGTGSAFWFGRLVFLRGQRPGHFEARETLFQSRKSRVLLLLPRLACFRFWVLKCVVSMVAIADGGNDCMPAALIGLIALQWNRIDGRNHASPGI